MTFLSPLWLLGLLPWGGVIYWLLQRRRRPTSVPFIELWRGPFHPPKPTTQFARPPIAVALVMLAMGLAIVAAAGPAVNDPLGRGGRPIPIVIDRGAGMSAGEPRFQSALQTLQQELMKAGVGALRRIDLYVVLGLGATRLDVSDLTNPQLLTATDTRAAVAATAARVLGETSGPVIVVSDQPLGITSDRLIQVAPPSGETFRNVGIARVAARATPKPQVMVTLGGRAWSQPVRVIVSSDNAETATTIDPPGDAQPREAFVDVPRLGPTVEVRLDVSDDAPADDRAWLVRQGSWPRIEAAAPLAPGLQRVIESYAATRPPGDGSARVTVFDELSKAGDQPAVILPGRRDGRSMAGEMKIAPHPVTRDVKFDTVVNPAVVTDPPAGWTWVVQRGNDTWVSVSESPVRQVWVGFEDPEWARSPEFVVFWAAVFDWVGGGGEAEYLASAPGDLGAEWVPMAMTDDRIDANLWPALFRRSDGAVRAVNSGLVTPGTVAPAADWTNRLAALRTDGQVTLSPYILIAALACLLLATAAWKRPSLTEISGKTTVAADGVLTETRAARAEAKSSPIPTK